MSNTATEHRADNAEQHLDVVLGEADFSERHRRVVRAPADRVWAATLELGSSEIRLMAPLLALRSIPGLLRGRGFSRPRVDQARILDALQRQGFVELYRDERLADGRAFVSFGVAGRFWSPAGNQPVPFDGPDEFRTYGQPGIAKAVITIEVLERGADAEVITETRIVCTDPGSRRAFGIYWRLIRGPSGLIRRGWLAAIARRANRP